MMLLPWTPWGRLHSRPLIFTRFRRLHCVNIATGRHAVLLRMK